MASAHVTLKFTGEDTPRRLGLRPIGLVATERKFGGKAFEDHPIEATLFAAWVSAGKPGADFDAWSATVEDLVNDEESPDPSSATLPAPSPPSL